MYAPPARRSAALGLSLIEVMVSLAILVVGVMSMMGAMATSNEVKNRARSQGLALEAIQAEIEKLQALSFNEIASKVPVTPSGLGFSVAGLQLQTGMTTAGSMTRLADSTTSLLHLRFTVSWKDVQGPGTLQIDYYHTNRGS